MLLLIMNYECKLNIMMLIFEYKSKSKVMKMLSDSVSGRAIFKIFLGGMLPDLAIVWYASNVVYFTH